MSSLTIMQAAVSSVKCALKLKPSFAKKSFALGRSLTGRFTNIFVDSVGVWIVVVSLIMVCAPYSFVTSVEIVFFLKRDSSRDDLGAATDTVFEPRQKYHWQPPAPA